MVQKHDFEERHHKHYTMPYTLVLFNGLQITDSPPGQVGRYKSRRPGSWQCARILLYVYASSFPRLWTASSVASRRQDANNSSFQYRWTVWLSALSSMRKDTGAWAMLANHLVTTAAGVDHRTITDIAKAVIELALRDAEIERNAYASHPRYIAAYWVAGGSNSNHCREEQAFMGRVRRAIANNEREVERCIYAALACCDASVVHRIAARAPQGNVVFSTLSRF